MDQLAQQVEAAKLLAAAARELLRLCETIQSKRPSRARQRKDERLSEALFEKTQSALQTVAAAHEICMELLEQNDTRAEPADQQ